VRGRMKMSWSAFWSHGFSGWRMRRRCNQMASELAFHRSRVARGFHRNAQEAAEREEEYRSTLHELRQQFAQRQQGRR
jgi:hypothetical protein